jgi:hypothetical protein
MTSVLNLVSQASGDMNTLLYGNPTKTFFKAKYNHITNFACQKFRIEPVGNRALLFDKEVEYRFPIPRHADLLADTYIVIDLPNIYSPLAYNEEYFQTSGYMEYGFKWINNLGTSIIKDVQITLGGHLLARYDGEYMTMVANRTKTETWNEMTGNIAELNKPDMAFNRSGYYPNANSTEPSIRGRQLYIPLSAWFCNMSYRAFPLVATRYVEMEVIITFRKLSEWYRIRNVNDIETVDVEGKPIYIAPLASEVLHQLFHFLQPPKATLDELKTLTPSQYLARYTNRNNTWNINVHLLGNYIYLDTDEQRLMAQQALEYVVYDVVRYEYLNTTGSKSVNIDTTGFVASYMWRFRRSDVSLRNEWTNYTNWDYLDCPSRPIQFISGIDLKIAGDLTTSNDRNILIDLGILLNGEYRENLFNQGMYKYVEQYSRATGEFYDNELDGIYHYNFCLDGDKIPLQPTGATDMTKYRRITFEFNTINPPPAENPILDDICDDQGNIIGTRKNLWTLNKYNYDLVVYEERLNKIAFIGGLGGLMFAR